MNEKALRIVFLGTPDFAVATLAKLVENSFNVVAVVTAPDKPAGRGKKIRSSPVKEFALEHGLKLLQPAKLRDEQFMEELSALQPDVMVVVAFRMLPRVVWSLPVYGTFNLHASLLPDYRGAAPINWAIINGETETGITTFFIDEKIDTGRILLQKRLPVLDEENAGSLHDRLMEEGAELVTETLSGIASNSLMPVSQEESAGEKKVLHQAPKISKEDCRINWNEGTMKIHNLIRGLSPFPGAFTFLEVENESEKLFKILEATGEVLAHKELPGTIYTDNKTTLRVATRDGWIGLKKIQLEGKRVMELEEFLRGFSFKPSSSRFS